MNKREMCDALKSFVSTIDNTGGVYAFNDGTHAPVTDKEWIDLGEAYMQACRSLRVKPKTVRPFEG